MSIKVKKYKYKFPIGDWSDDGHGKCEWFLVSGDKSVQNVIDAHFKCKEIFGFLPGEMCRKYQENEIKHKLVSQLKKTANIDIEEYDGLVPEDLLDIWISMINHVDTSLNLKIITDKIPHIHQSDIKDRIMDVPGYGLFE